MLKVAVLVSGGGTNLQAILDAEKNQIITHAKVSLVISSSASAFALERAKKAEIATAVVAKKDFCDTFSWEQGMIALLKEHEIDLIVLAGFMCILSNDFIKAFPEQIINVHPSLIPSFCGEGFYGLKVHQAALEKGVQITGATVHFVNEIVDGGKIIAQKAVEIAAHDTPETLQKRVMQQAEWDILPKAIEWIATQKQ